MGGLCGCFAGVDKAAAGKSEEVKAAPATVAQASERQPLLEPKAAPSSTGPAAAAPQPVAAPQKDFFALDEPKESLSAILSSKAAQPFSSEASMGASAAPAPAEAFAREVMRSSEPAATGESMAALIEAESMGVGSCLEIFSNSYQAWCPGVIYGLESSSVLVAYQVPGEPADANISTKTLPVDSNELQMPAGEGSWLAASVEVYSHSNKAWCLGKITEIVDGVASVVFFYPNEPADAVPVMKQLPLGDKDLRLRGIDAAFQVSLPGGGLGHETLRVNDAVEVYSNSLGIWCPGIVQDLDTEVVTVAFFYPDMDPNKEQPAVKELPLGHQDLRLPGYATGAPHTSGPPVSGGELVVGRQIEVYSQSREVWIKAKITQVQDGNVTMQLRYPDMPDDSELYEKVLPIGHGDMRLAE